MTFPNAKEIHRGVLSHDDVVTQARKQILSVMKSCTAMSQCYDSMRGSYSITTGGKVGEIPQFTLRAELCAAGWMVVSVVIGEVRPNWQGGSTTWELKPI